MRRWMFVIALVALLFVRALVYYHIGPSVAWSPKLHLGPMTLSFRSDLFHLMLAYSVIGFAAMLAGFYMWLLLLSFLGGNEAAGDPFLGLARAHLGGVGHWPWPLRLILPMVVAALLWLALAPALHWLGVVPRPGAWLARCEQATLLGLSVYLSWKFLIVGVLALHLLHSYVYLGRNQLWNFITLAARSLLIPLRRLPLRLERVDFAPVVGIALVCLVAHVAENGLRISSTIQLPGLAELYLRASR